MKGMFGLSMHSYVMEEGELDEDGSYLVRPANNSVICSGDLPGETKDEAFAKGIAFLGRQIPFESMRRRAKPGSIRLSGCGSMQR
jgi:hypothetical protein